MEREKKTIFEYMGVKVKEEHKKIGKILLLGMASGMAIDVLLGKSQFWLAIPLIFVAILLLKDILKRN